MSRRANKHIKKYNQLVEVYDPDGIEPIETVQSRLTDQLERRKVAIDNEIERVETLTADSFFDEKRQTEIRETESLPDPAQVATSQREDLLDRLTEIEEALDAALSEEMGLDTEDGLGF